MLKRAIFGGIFVAILVVCIVLGGLYFHVLFALMAVISLNEFYGLYRKKRISPNVILGILIGLAFYILGSWGYSQSFLQPYLLILGIMSFPIIALSELYRKKRMPFENIGITMLGWAYIVLPLILLNDLMWDNTQETWTNYLPVLSIFIMVWTSDTFAYLIGKNIGKHKLFERISPNKSWEGFFGGALFAALAGGLIAYYINESIWVYVGLGLIIATVGTLGDLIESMLKRSLNVKDSGKIIPGHGGILDRIDAVLYVIPVVYVYFYLMSNI